MQEDRRGILYPQRLPEFHRLEPPHDLAHAVRWFWIPGWNLEPGAESRQQILPFPACNLVIDPEGITAIGPPTRRSERVLRGSGWAVGALLRAAAAPSFIDDLADMRDGVLPIEAPGLHRDVVGAMGDPLTSSDSRRERATATFSQWLRSRVPEAEPGSDAALANELERLLADPAIVRVDQLPLRLHVSARTLQRLADRHFGLSPHAMIRRRRLQEGAQRLREDRTLTISALSGELGYADHAHFTRDFKSLLGVTPSEYREQQTWRVST